MESIATNKKMNTPFEDQIFMTRNILFEPERILSLCLFVSLDAFIEGKWVSHIRDLASRPRGVEKGASLPPVLMVGMNKQS